MSRHVVGYEGVGKSRRPIYLDEGPASSAVRDPIAAIGVLSATQVNAPTGGSGQVEISRIEVDEATRSEAKAARTNPTPGFHGVRPAAEQMQASRMNGAARHVEVMAARKPSAQEETVSEASTNGSTHIPEIIPSATLAADVGFDRLAMAAESARTAWDAKAAADTAWDVAREALAMAYASVEDMVEPNPTPPDDDHVHQILTVPISPPQPAVKSRPRSRTGEGQRPGQASERDQRAALVMAAMDRLGDDQGAVAAELGMKKNAVAQIVKHARRRAGATS